MADLKYNFLDNDYFTVFEPVEVETPTINMPLFDTPQYTPSYVTRISDDGTPVVGNNLESKMTINNTEEYVPTSSTTTETPVEYSIQQIINYDPSIEKLSGNEKKAMQFFMNKGLKKHQAAGLVGNLMRESRLNPIATNPHGGAFGLAQWLGKRQKALFNKYGKRPTFEQQLDFIWEELNSTHKRGLEALRSSNSFEEAARNAMGYYEFSVGPEGAISAMRKSGQNGELSMRQGINFAKLLMK